MAQDIIAQAFNGAIDKETLKKELTELDNYFVRFYLESAQDTSLNEFVSEKHNLLHSLIEVL